MEQLCLQEDLSVCNGNNVGRDICRNVSCLCLDNRKGSQRTAAMCIIQSWLHAPEVWNGDRIRLQDKPHVPVDDGSAGKVHGKQPHAYLNHHK